MSNITTTGGQPGRCGDVRDCSACCKVDFTEVARKTVEELAGGHESFEEALDWWLDKQEFLDECCGVEDHQGGPEDALQACRIAIMKIRVALAGGNDQSRSYVVSCEATSGDATSITYRAEAADGRTCALRVTRRDSKYAMSVGRWCDTRPILGERVRRKIRREFLLKFVLDAVDDLSCAANAVDQIDAGALADVIRTMAWSVKCRTVTPTKGIPLVGVMAPHPDLAGSFAWVSEDGMPASPTGRGPHDNERAEGDEADADVPVELF